MDDYKEIRIWGYNHGNQDPTEEYNRRYNSYGVIHTGLQINPIFHGERSEKKYELFLVTIPELLKLQDAVVQKSKKITELTTGLPQIAFNQLFNNTLVNEIVSTNEIEDVKTTSEEVNDAISNVNSKRNTRLQSFVRMYYKIKDCENLSITTPKDVRKIYDFLLKGEIPEKKLPDGKFFRNSYTRIGNSQKTVHLPKVHENDFLPDILNWINFINSNDPALFKAFIAHYYFEYIHPFNDGNGRTGRYITCVYLGYKLDRLSAITFSSEVNKNRSRYYDAFVNVENPKNFGEITFFVIDMLKILAKGQNKLIEDLETKNSLLQYGWSILDNKYEKQEYKDILFLYYQAFLFNDLGYGIEDRELTENYLKKYSRASVRRIIDSLVETNVLQITKRSPLTRRLTKGFVSKFLN